MNHTSIKLVVADDHPVVLHGLVSLLRSELDFRVLAACEDGVTALEAIFKHSPDIALLDLRLPKMTGLEVLGKVSHENLKTRVVILTAFTEDRDVLTAISAGVYGIIMKDSVTTSLVECLRIVGAGGRCLPSELVKKELHRLTEAASIGKALTAREHQVMRSVAEGLSNKQIAQRLRLSEGTVKLHLHNIYSKTGVSSRSELVTLALRLGGALENQ